MESAIVHIAQKFAHLLETYHLPDGRRWTGAALEKATAGVVTRSYMTNLRKGRIESPGYEKLAAIARLWVFRLRCGLRREPVPRDRWDQALRVVASPVGSSTSSR